MSSKSTDSKPKVYITENGGRYVKSEEYFSHPRVIEVLNAFSEFKVSSDSSEKPKEDRASSD